MSLLLPPLLLALLQAQSTHIGHVVALSIDPAVPSSPSACPVSVRYREPSAFGNTTVLLHSHPGSGNTWVRLLLENSTGLTNLCLYLQGMRVWSGDHHGW